MKKLLLSIFVMVMSVTFASAQTFGVGSKVGTAQISLSGALDIPMPITLSYEQGFASLGDIFSVGAGGTFDFGSANNTTLMFIGAICNIHYAEVQNFDFSVGASLGFESWKNKDTDVSDTGLGLNLNLAAKYYFSDTLGIVANFGTGYSDFSAGICMKF